MNLIEQEKLHQALKEQATYYQEILEVSKNQSEFISQGKILELFPGFNKVNELITKVQEIQSGIQEAKATWETEKINLSKDERIPIDGELEKIENLLSEILALDKKQQDSIGEQQKRNRNDVTKINRGQQIAKAYGNAYKPAPSLNSLVDKRT